VPAANWEIAVFEFPAQTPPDGLALVPGALLANGTCWWLGIWFWVRVTSSTPNISPITWPLLWWTGKRPRRSGNPKVSWPLPP
jgi:hypothetical protein